MCDTSLSFKRVNMATHHKAAFMHVCLFLLFFLMKTDSPNMESLFMRVWLSLLHVFQLVKRVYKGIPLQLRGQAWALLLDIEKVKEENNGKYEVWPLDLVTTTLKYEYLLFYTNTIFVLLSFQKMKQQARSFSTEIKQIDLDVNRTFRNHIMFMDRFGIKWVPSLCRKRNNLHLSAST